MRPQATGTQRCRVSGGKSRTSRTWGLKGRGSGGQAEEWGEHPTHLSRTSCSQPVFMFCLKKATKGAGSGRVSTLIFRQRRVMGTVKSRTCICAHKGRGGQPFTFPLSSVTNLNGLKTIHYLGAPWLAQSQERATLDLGVPSSSPTLCIEITLKT